MEEGRAQAEWPLMSSHQLAEGPGEGEEGTWILGNVGGSSHRGHMAQHSQVLSLGTGT